jgi:hypothetical protein
MGPYLRPLRATAAAAATFALLTSCAGLAAFTPERDARAPQLTGFGVSQIAVTTRVDAARRLFNEGVLQAYAFNEVEAVRMFKAALAQDPHCAMCAWGVAWQLGPNINDNGRGGTAEALNYVDYALRHLDAATPRERALVESLALRYAHASQQRETAPLTAPTCGKADDDDEKPDPLDVAYAGRMRKLADSYPDDPDVLSLYVEAEMIATEGNFLWDKEGKPAGRIGDVAQRLDRLLPAHPAHTGLNHYTVHVYDALAVAARAEVAADRLGVLAPSSPHLVHMPAHTYVHVGRYADAARVNALALAADDNQDAAQKAQGFSTSKDWRGHNGHFLWYAAVMAGREEEALAAADRMAQDAGARDNVFAEYLRSLRLVTLVRLERWDDVLQAAQPKGEKGMAQAWFEYARGTAHARLGRIDAARESLARLQPAAERMRKDLPSNSSSHRRARGMADMAESGLRAEIALAQRDFDEALAQQRKMVEASTRPDRTEPPRFADGTRLTLGAMQLRAGRWTDAEATYRQGLVDHPGSGWALRGLVQALKGQGRARDAQAVQQQLDRAWESASPRLRAA